MTWAWLNAPSHQVNLYLTSLASEDAAICRYGYNTWRDALKPTALLEKMCKEAGLDEPTYQPGHVIVDGERFYEQESVENEQGFFTILPRKA